DHDRGLVRDITVQELDVRTTSQPAALPEEPGDASGEEEEDQASREHPASRSLHPHIFQRRVSIRDAAGQGRYHWTAASAAATFIVTHHGSVTLRGPHRRTNPADGAQDRAAPTRDAGPRTRSPPPVSPPEQRQPGDPDVQP